MLHSAEQDSPGTASVSLFARITRCSDAADPDELKAAEVSACAESTKGVGPACLECDGAGDISLCAVLTLTEQPGVRVEDHP